jgi:hypothetical protein
MTKAASFLRETSFMRSFGLPFVLIVSGISACSFLLDTEALQKGGSAVSSDGGSSGESGSGGAGGSAAPPDGSPMCATDFDCQGPNFDGCKVVHCVSGKCGASEKWSGLGVVPEGNVELVTQADEIGYPTLLVDNGNSMPNVPNFYLGVWKHEGTTTNIELHRYNENPSLGGGSADLAGIFPAAYEQFGSSPGMAVVGLLGGRLRLLFAGDPTGAAPMGMHEVDIDEGTFKAAPVAQQPKVDPGVPGFDTKPRGPAPRMISDNWGMWVQGEKLFFFDNQTAAMPVYTAKRVLGFAPIIGIGGPYAVLETEPAANPAGAATEIWASGSNSLFALVGDMAGARRGATATFYPEAVDNVVVWSSAGPGGPSLRTNVAGCLGALCQAFGGDMIKNSENVPAAFPEISSAKVAGRDRDRDFAESFQITFANPSDPSKATTALVGSVIRVETTADAGADSGATTAPVPVNPPNFLITAQDAAVSAAPGEVIGPTSIAMTNNGHVMATWVERGMGAQTHVLKTRRFLVKQCN